MHSSDHAAIDRSVGHDEVRRPHQRGEAVVGLVELRADAPERARQALDEADDARTTAAGCDTTTSSTSTAAAPRPAQSEPAREAERAEDDEDDDADDVGHALGDDDGRRARDGHAVRLEEHARDLKTSPTLPGVTVRTKPLRNVSRLSTRGHAADARGARGRTPT